MTPDVQRALDDIAASLREIRRRVADLERRGDSERLVELERVVDDMDRRMRPYGDGSRPARRRSPHGE